MLFLKYLLMLYDMYFSNTANIECIKFNKSSSVCKEKNAGNQN